MKDTKGHGSDPRGAHAEGVQSALSTQRPADPARVQSFVAGAQGILNDYYQKNFPTTFAAGNLPKLEITNPDAPKYLRVAATERAPDGTVTSRSAHTFIDRTTGDVLKPSGWKAPATGVRGNIHDEHNGLGRMGPHGPAYNR